MTYRFTFPGHPARINELLGHWGKAAKRKKLDRDTVAIVARDIPKAKGKRRVDIHLIMGPRQRTPDPDSSWKSLLDSLVACGQLVDDRKECCELGSVTFSRGKAAETVVTLTDLIKRAIESRKVGK